MKHFWKGLFIGLLFSCFIATIASATSVFQIYQGGTGNNTSTAGQVIFASTSSTIPILTGSNNLWWVTSTSYLGIQTTTPEFELSLDNDGSIISIGSSTFSVTMMGVDVNPQGATLTTAGGGDRMFWYARDAAFRAGYIATGTNPFTGNPEPGDQWDDGNIGFGSLATGINDEAADLGSVSLGVFNTVNSGSFFNPGGVALGVENNNYNGGVLIGQGNTASGTGNGSSYIFGAGNTDNIGQDVMIGYNNTVNGSMSGNNITLGSDATINGNYDTSLGQEIQIDGENDVGVDLNQNNQSPYNNFGASPYDITSFNLMPIVGGAVSIGTTTPPVPDSFSLTVDAADIQPVMPATNNAAEFANGDVEIGTNNNPNAGLEVDQTFQQAGIPPITALFNNGNVGIGDDVPPNLLSVAGTTTLAEDSGRVGIGTSSPTYGDLEVVGDGHNTGDIRATIATVNDGTAQPNDSARYCFGGYLNGTEFSPCWASLTSDFDANGGSNFYLLLPGVGGNDPPWFFDGSSSPNRGYMSLGETQAHPYIHPTARLDVYDTSTPQAEFKWVGTNGSAIGGSASVISDTIYPTSLGNLLGSWSFGGTFNTGTGAGTLENENFVTSTASLRAYAAQRFATGTYGTNLGFFVTPIGTSTPLRSMFLDNDGAVSVGLGFITPTTTLAVGGTTSIGFTGDLEPNWNPGTAGQVLESQGAGVPPIWLGGSSGGIVTASGTPGYFPFYNSANVLSSTSSIYENSSTGEVAIGSMFPNGSTQLTISGDAPLAGNFTLTDGFGNSFTGNAEDSMSIGQTNSISSLFDAAFGLSNTISEPYSLTSGESNEIDATNSVAFGQSNLIENGSDWSFAAGDQNTITGQQLSFAFGVNNTVGGQDDFAFGDGNTNNGYHSEAFGNGVDQTGQGSMGFELGNIGGGSVVFPQNDTFAVMNGNVGFGTTTPTTTLVVNGTTTVETAVTLTEGAAHSGQATCFLSDGTLGYCSSVVGVGGACTCNHL